MKDKTIQGKANIFYDAPIEIPFTYKDSYFFDKSTVFNRELANLSMTLAMSAFQSSYTDFKTGPNNLKEFLERLEFKDFVANSDYTEKTKSDTFGIGIAHKKINVNGKPFTLIAIGLRGNGYTAEWGGNFNIGEAGPHAGFDICANKGISLLKKYICDHKIIGNIKVWTTGFSRAAAGANMICGYLDELIDCGGMLGFCVRLTKKNIYAYTFETPNGADAVHINTRSSKYNNIFNILLKGDVVPLMGPRGMGFARYGTDCYLPSYGSEDYASKKKAMMKVYNQYAPSSTRMTFITKTLQDKFMFIHADFESTSLIQMITDKTTCPEYNNKMIDMMTERIGQRDGFIRCQKEFSAILSDMLGANFQFAMATLVKIAFAIGKSPEKLFAFAVAKNKLGMINYLEKIITETVTEMGFTVLSVAEVEKLATSIEKYLSDFIHAYPNETITFFVNMGCIASYHDPIVVYSWLMTLPDDYFDNLY